MTLKLILLALMIVESSMGRDMVNHANSCRGWLQMKVCFVKDCNRILREHGETLRYSLADRYDKRYSLEMAAIAVEHYLSPGEYRRIPAILADTRYNWRDVARLIHYGHGGMGLEHDDEAQYLGRVEDASRGEQR